MDIALILSKLVPAAKCRGSLTANTEEAYNALVWQDERDKPSWDELQQVVIEPPPVNKQQTINETLEILIPILETIYTDESLMTDIKAKLPEEIKVALGEKIEKLKGV